MAPAEIINIGKYIFGHEEHYTIVVGLDIFYLELTENNWKNAGIWLTCVLERASVDSWEKH